MPPPLAVARGEGGLDLWESTLHPFAKLLRPNDLELDELLLTAYYLLPTTYHLLLTTAFPNSFPQEKPPPIPKVCYLKTIEFPLLSLVLFAVFFKVTKIGLLYSLFLVFCLGAES